MATRHSPARAVAWGPWQWTHVALSVIGLAVLLWCSRAVIVSQIPRWSPSAKGYSLPSVQPHGILRWASDAWNRWGWGNAILSYHTTFTLPDRYAIARSENGDTNGFECLGPEILAAVRNQARSASERGRGVWWVSHDVSHLNEQGWWATTSADWEYDVSVDFTPGSGGLSLDEFREVRRVYFEALDPKWIGEYRFLVPTLITNGSGSTPRTAWSGYALNAGTLAGLGVFLWFARVSVRDVRRWQQWKRGGCAGCGYDVRGLPDGSTVCPECGRPLREAMRPAG